MNSAIVNEAACTLSDIMQSRYSWAIRVYLANQCHTTFLWVTVRRGLRKKASNRYLFPGPHKKNYADFVLERCGCMMDDYLSNKIYDFALDAVEFLKSGEIFR